MPSFITVRFLLAVIIIGAAVALALLLLVVVFRTARFLLGRRRARVESQVRPAMLQAIAGEGVDAELVHARGGRGRAVDRLAFAYLARVRGEGHDLLADLLEQRGVISRVIRRSAWPGPNWRAAAASRLGLIASTEADQRLQEMALGDSSTRVRIVAARGLGKAGTAEAADTLLSLLGPVDLVPEGIVASALLELGPEAVPALRQTLRSGPGGVGSGGVNTGQPEPHAGTGPHAGSGPQAGNGHRRGVPGQQLDGRRRAMAADVLGLLDVMPAWEDLVRCVQGSELLVRISAVRALGRLGVPQAADAIIRCLAPGEDGALRSAAARALGRIGSPHSVGPLTDCLGDPDYWVAHNAAAALAMLGHAGRQALARTAAVNAPGAPHAREALVGARLLVSESVPEVPVPSQSGGTP
jgi:HEAT repeat protein